MHCPSLKELPTPPAGKSGWPWSEACDPLSARMVDGSEWPRITIVTPCYNLGQYLEEALRSVLLQGYPNLEYIVMDGGSNDCTIDVLRRYERWLSFWVSEKDAGQGDAINKGFARATGEIVAWLNADDAYFPGTFPAVGAAMVIGFPQAVAVYGKTAVFDEGDCFTGKFEGEPMAYTDMAVELTKVYPTPSAFFRLSSVRTIGPLDNSLYFTLDWDYWLRIGMTGPIEFYDQVWAKFRLYGTSKTGCGDVRAQEEVIALNERFWKRHDLPESLMKHRSRALMRLHLKYARRFWCDGHTSLFRRELWRALRADLRAPFHPQWRRFFPYALAGTVAQEDWFQ